MVPLLERDEERVLEATDVARGAGGAAPGAVRRGAAADAAAADAAVAGAARSGEGGVLPAGAPARPRGRFDFTHATELGVTIAGRGVRAPAVRAVLSFSGWTYARLAFSETFEALSRGLQEALWALGGVPGGGCARTISRRRRTSCKLDGGRALTARYRALLEHYGMRSTRIQPGEVPRERRRGAAALTAPRALLAQALVIRGSKDFASLDGLRSLRATTWCERSNRPREAKLALGASSSCGRCPRRRCRPTRPSIPHVTPLEHDAGGRADLLGAVAADRPRGGGAAAPRRWSRSTTQADAVETMPRLRGEQDGPHRLPARDLVAGAQARRLRALPLPRGAVPDRSPSAAPTTRCVERRGERADVEYVRILHLAASTMESTVEPRC